MSNIAIRVENLSKQYRIVAARSRHDTLRDQIMYSVKSVFGLNGQPLKQNSKFEFRNSNSDNFWALKDVSFEVKQGEVVGVIGRNGAGKSTLLKILSRITEPTSGGADIHGRVGSLLEVGTGFHSDLTGRENVYFSGAILGMKKVEIDRKFDEMVAFAEVEKFIDTPVKHYSSGMSMRLAFAVAAHLEPEILLVDEVLAVGDVSFQNKCLGKIDEVTKGGRTVLFVSHNMAALTRLCRWGIWLDNGQLRAFTNTEEIVARYIASGVQELPEVTFPDDLQRAPGTEQVRLLAVRIRNSEGEISSTLDLRLPFTIEIEYRIVKRISNLRIGLTLIAHDGIVVFSSIDTDKSGDELDKAPGEYRAVCTIPGELLKPGQYYISVASDVHRIQTHFFLERVLGFRVAATNGYVPDGRTPLLRLRLPWSTQQIHQDRTTT